MHIGNDFINEDQRHFLITDPDILKDSIKTDLASHCEQAIYSGIDVKLSNGETRHFSLSNHDQINLFGKQSQLFQATPSDVFEYHSDGDICVYYSYDDMTNICRSAIAYVSFHTTYCNALFFWLKQVTTVEELGQIRYGVEIPDAYQTEVLKDYIAKYPDLAAQIINGGEDI